MPDLITHTSFNYLIYKILKNRFNLPLFLFGTFLPDFFSAIGILLVDGFKLLNYFDIITGFLAPSHSLLTGLVFGIIVHLLFKREKKPFISFLMGYYLHLFLDFLQNNWGLGNILLYPFSFQPISLKLFTFGVEYSYIYLIIPLSVLFYIFFKEKQSTLHIKTTKREILICFVILLSLGLLSALTIQRVIQGNIYFLNFRNNPHDFHKKTVLLNNTRPENENPPIFNFRGNKIYLKNTAVPVNKKKAYLIKGIYNHKKKSLSVERIIDVVPHIKAYISGLGLFLLILFFLIKVRIQLI